MQLHYRVGMQTMGILGIALAMGAGAMELRVVDFTSADAPAWQAVNDGVMGGLSRSRLWVSADGFGVFEGEVSLENGGGFASVRTNVTLDLSAYHGLALRLRGDGRRYRIRLRTDEGFDGIAYQASFPTGGEGWETVVVPFTQFGPTFRGREVPQAPPLDLTHIRQIGLMIADRQAGTFRLELRSITAVLTQEGSHAP